MATLLTYREEIERGAHVLAEHHTEIKAFVLCNGSRAADLLKTAALTAHGDVALHSHADHDQRSLHDATEIVHSIGLDAATALVDVVQWYYESSVVDVWV